MLTHDEFLRREANNHQATAEVLQGENLELIAENKRLHDAIRADWNMLIGTFAAGIVLGVSLILLFTPR